MNDTENIYWIRWKGATWGPYSKEDILSSLSQGNIGLYHEVFREGEPARPLRTWIAQWKETSESETPDSQQRECIQQGYLWCGLSFILPPLLAMALLNAQGIQSAAKRQTQYLLASGLAFFGTFLWILLAATW